MVISILIKLFEAGTFVIFNKNVLWKSIPLFKTILLIVMGMAMALQETYAFIDGNETVRSFLDSETTFKCVCVLAIVENEFYPKGFENYFSFEGIYFKI
jgi:hypothetical protein